MAELETLVIYGDFNCPFSALASARAALLEARSLARIDWRAVEHDPGLPAAGEPVDGPVREALEGEIGQIRGLLAEGEPDPLSLPPIRPKTRLVTAAYAAAPPEERPRLRQRIFRALWLEGADLSDAGVVASLVGQDLDQATADRWHDEWSSLPQQIVPVMVLPDGYVSKGLGALARLAERAGLT